MNTIQSDIKSISNSPSNSPHTVQDVLAIEQEFQQEKVVLREKAAKKLTQRKQELELDLLALQERQRSMLKDPASHSKEVSYQDMQEREKKAEDIVKAELTKNSKKITAAMVGLLPT